MSQSPKSPPKIKGLKKPKNYNELGIRDKASYIVKKYVKPLKIDWKRDIFIACKLLEKCPELSFWYTLDCKFKIDSLVILWGKTARQRLENEYRKFKQQLDQQKKIVVPDKVEYAMADNKIGEDMAFGPKPKSIMEFCKDD